MSFKTFNKMHISKVMTSNILSYILPGPSGEDKPVRLTLRVCTSRTYSNAVAALQACAPAAGAPLMETLNTDVAS